MIINVLIGFIVSGWLAGSALVVLMVLNFLGGLFGYRVYHR